MRCPTSGKDFDTGLEIARKKDALRNLDLQTVVCPYCKLHHYVRLPFFDGDAPTDDYFPADGLETAPAFAMEVGTIVAAATFMEAYIPQIFAKISGMSLGHSGVTFGAFPGTYQKIELLKVLLALQQDKETQKILKMLIKKFQKCNDIRNFYAHAKYSYSGGHTINIIPFFGDSRKRSEACSKSIDEFRDDASFLWRTKFMIRDYIMNGTPPR